MKSPSTIRLFLVIASQVLASHFFSQVIYVKHNATGANDGTSWENAYSDLEYALANTTDDTILWIAAGIYHPGGLNPGPTSVFAIHNNLSLYGGFAGNETSFSERDPVLNVTILSGDILEDDIQDDFTNNKSDNTRHVMYVDSLLDMVIIDGVTIKGGHTSDNPNSSIYDLSGGGIYALSPVHINASNITGNFGRICGGIFLAKGASNSFITQSTFSHNKTTDRSAGIYAVSISDLQITHCTFIDNQTVRGALYPFSCTNVLVDSCLFQDNTNTIFNGGAIFSFQNINLLVRNSDFIRNSAVTGGAITVNGGQLPFSTLTNIQIEKCNFEANSATAHAGAIFNFTNPEILIRNCNFIDNTAPSGGAVLIEEPQGYPSDTNKIKIDSCLFSRNSAHGLGGGAFRLRFTSAKIEHCTFENNTTMGLIDGDGGHVFQNCPGQQIIYRDVSFINGVSIRHAGAVAVYGENANYLFDRCMFRDNSANYFGGAVHHTFAVNATYKNCSFINNASLESSGGAMAFAYDSSEVHVENSFFIGNEAAGNGGAIYSGFGSCIINVSQCELDSNNALTGFGGAIFISEPGDDIAALNIHNSLLGFNSSEDEGGAVHITDADTYITNTVFYENICNGSGVGAALAIKATDQDSVKATIINSTFADNYGYIADGLAMETGDMDVELITSIQNCIFSNKGYSNCNINGGTPLLDSRGGNMSDDESMIDYLTHPKDLNQVSPIFIDPDNFIYSLTYNSPGINGGVTLDAPEFDILGNPRVNEPDMGAYENQFPVSTKETEINDSDNLTISPNPVSAGLADLTLTNAWRGNLIVNLIDLNGRIMSSTKIFKSSDTVRFNILVNDLSPGTYQVQVSNEKMAAMKSMIRI